MSLQQVLVLLLDTDSIAQRYDNTIRAEGPIQFLRMNETTGTVAVDSSGNGRDAAYNGVVLASIDSLFPPDRAPEWDDDTDNQNLYSASLSSAFSLDEGCVLMWVKVADASLWTDATTHYLAEFQASGNERIYIRKQTTDNTIRASRIANAGADFQIVDMVIDTTDWFSIIVSWSNVNDEFKVYVNGIQSGATVTGLDISGQTINAAVIGNTVSVSTGWLGHISHVAVFDKPVTPGIIAAAKQDYDSSVLALTPDAYWKLNEGGGTTVFDSSVNAFNVAGGYVNITHTANASPFNDSAPLLNGSSSYINLYSAGFAAAFDGTRGYLSLWYDPENNVLTDAADNYVLILAANGSNNIAIFNTATNNTFRFRYVAGGTTLQSDVVIGDTTPVNIIFDYADSANGDFLKVWVNNSLAVDLTGAGAFTGSLASSSAVLGAANTTPALVWDGYLSRMFYKAAEDTTDFIRTTLSNSG